MALSPSDKEEIENIIRETVNGKIDAIDRKIEDHMAEIDPFIKGWKGAKALGSAIKWVAGLIIAIAGASEATDGDDTILTWNSSGSFEFQLGGGGSSGFEWGQVVLKY